VVRRPFTRNDPDRKRQITLTPQLRTNLRQSIVELGNGIDGFFLVFAQVAVDCDNFQPLRVVSVVHFEKLGHSVHARTTPIAPEFKDDTFSLQCFQVDRGTILPRVDSLKLWCWQTFQ